MSGLNSVSPARRSAGLPAGELRRRLQTGVTVAALALGAVGLGGVLCGAAVVAWHPQASTETAPSGTLRTPGPARSVGIDPGTQLVRSSGVEARPERHAPPAETASTILALQGLVWGYGACVVAMLLVLWPLARRQVALLSAALEGAEPSWRGLAAPVPEPETIFETVPAATPAPQVDGLLSGSVEQLAAAVAALRRESLGIPLIQAEPASSERQGESVFGSTPARDLGPAPRVSDPQHL